MQFTKIRHSENRRILKYEVFYVDHQALFHQDRQVKILTVREDATDRRNAKWSSNFTLEIVKNGITRIKRVLNA